MSVLSQKNIKSYTLNDIFSAGTGINYLILRNLSAISNKLLACGDVISVRKNYSIQIYNTRSIQKYLYTILSVR